MTSNRRRKQAARAYQDEHGVDYTIARRVTELPRRKAPRERVAATATNEVGGVLSPSTVTAAIAQDASAVEDREPDRPPGVTAPEPA